jgi:hypothetical protein
MRLTETGNLRRRPYRPECASSSYSRARQMAIGEGMEPDRESDASTLSRREALARAAQLGGAFVWTVPFIRSVDLKATAALAGSGEPSDPGGGEVGGDTGTGVGGGDPGGGSGGASGGGGGTSSTLQITSLSLGPSPLKLGAGHRLRISFFVSGKADVRVSIVRGGHVVRSFDVRSLNGAGSVSLRWNGKNSVGAYVRSGRYDVVISATDGSGGATEARGRVRVRR